MATIKFSHLNPLQFHKVGSGSFAADQLPSFEEDKLYLQKFLHTDLIMIQALTIDTTQVSYRILNEKGVEVYEYEEGDYIGSYGDYTVWSSNDTNDILTTLPNGIYFLEISFVEDVTDAIFMFVSEPFQVLDELPESLLIEFSHDVNAFDMAFFPDGTPESKQWFQLRVEGGIPSDGFLPGSKDSYFIDQGRDVTLLDSTPYNVYKFTFGPKQGIPNWLANKINRILSLQEVVINDIQYTKNDGAKFESIREKEYPFAGWQIELVKVESEDSLVEENIVVVAEGLELTFDTIEGVVQWPSAVSDASSVSDWNTFFDLPTNGSPFTSVEVVGDMVRLIGGSFSIADYIFQNNTHLLKVIDTNAIQYGSIYTFDGCVNLTEIILPVVNNVGRYTFRNCSSLELLSIPNCNTLGDDEDSNNVFTGISGQSITLTVSSYLMTIFGGNPDGDIQYLQANNTVTIVTV